MIRPKATKHLPTWLWSTAAGRAVLVVLVEVFVLVDFEDFLVAML